MATFPESLTHEESLRHATELWRATSDNPADPTRSVWQTALNDQTLAVSITVPSLPAAAFCRWFGPRLILWPDGLPNQRITSVCSSAIGKRKDRHPEWFDALRTAALRLDTDRECLARVDSTAPADAVSRCCELFGIDCLHLIISQPESVVTSKLSDWMQQQTAGDFVQNQTTPPGEPVRRPMIWRAIISPRVEDISCPGHEPSERVPPDLLADAVLIAAGHRVVALHVRPAGRVPQLLYRQLTDPEIVAPVMLASPKRSVPHSDCQHLFDAGAVRWVLEQESQSTAAPTGRADAGRTVPVRDTGSAAVPSSQSPHGTSLLASSEAWLCHWTRARPGPWSDQPVEDFWDELILGCRTADRSAFATLLKILEEEKICGSTAGQGRRCVSFTEVPLCEFRSRRIFRRHKRQYDFELYGIAVRRSVLTKLGARPVTYVENNSDSGSVNRLETSFLQPATNAGGTIDWTAEREWRLPGDLFLRECSADELAVFVADNDEKQRLRDRCAWPVVCVPAD